MKSILQNVKQRNTLLECQISNISMPLVLVLHESAQPLSVFGNQQATQIFLSYFLQNHILFSVLVSAIPQTTSFLCDYAYYSDY